MCVCVCTSEVLGLYSFTYVSYISVSNSFIHQYICLKVILNELTNEFVSFHTSYVIPIGKRRPYLSSKDLVQQAEHN